MYLILFSVFSLILVRGATDFRNIHIVTQQNAPERYPDPRNRIRCQNITDVFPSPTQEAADDFVVPLPTWFEMKGVPHGLNDCSSMSFALETIRSRSDHDPSSITITLWKHDPLTKKPGISFFKKTLPWPTNNYLWKSDPRGLPFVSIITLQYNELGDDGKTRFDFRDPSFLPSATTFWFSFYATVPQHQSSLGFIINAMYWRTLNNMTNSTPRETFLHNGQENHDFVWRDPSDHSNYGYTEWVTGELLEEKIRLPASTNNLAWTVYFSCLVTDLWTDPPTSQPSLSPTLQPTLETSAPILVMNESERVGYRDLVVGISIPVVLLLVCIIVLLFVLTARRCWKKSREAEIVVEEIALPKEGTREAKKEIHLEDVLCSYNELSDGISFGEKKTNKHRSGTSLFNNTVYSTYSEEDDAF